MNDLFDTLSQEDHTTPRLSRQQRRALAAKKKREAARRRKSLIAVFFAVLIFGGGIAFAWSWGVEFFNGLSFNAPRVSEAPADYEGEGTEAVEVTVNEGIRELPSQRLLSRRMWWHRKVRSCQQRTPTQMLQGSSQGRTRCTKKSQPQKP